VLEDMSIAGRAVEHAVLFKLPNFFWK